MHTLAQQDGDEAVEAVLARARFAVDHGGGAFSIDARCAWLRLGRELGMAGPGISQSDRCGYKVPARPRSRTSSR